MRRDAVVGAIGVVILLALGCEVAKAQTGILEYTDSEYGFAFQYPADWELETAIDVSALGQVRAIAKHPTNAMYVAAIVGEIGTSVSREALVASPKAKQIVDEIIAFTIKEVYQKSIESQHLENMKVAQTAQVNSSSAIEFYIATFSTFKATIVSMAGLHAVPFDKPYMISFIEVSSVDPEATQANDMLRRTFNSFHLAGDPPIQ